jgi:hypothetical protein
VKLTNKRVLPSLIYRRLVRFVEDGDVLEDGDVFKAVLVLHHLCKRRTVFNSTAHLTRKRVTTIDSAEVLKTPVPHGQRPPAYGL